jgi:hypothetical protein
MKVKKGIFCCQYSHFSEFFFQIAVPKKNCFGKKKKKKKHFGTFGVWTLILV